MIIYIINLSFKFPTATVMKDAELQTEVRDEEARRREVFLGAVTGAFTAAVGVVVSNYLDHSAKLTVAREAGNCVDVSINGSGAIECQAFVNLCKVLAGNTTEFANVSLEYTSP